MILLLSYTIQIGSNWISFKKLLFYFFLMMFLLFYLLFTNFYITFFSYFTNLVSYQTYKSNSYYQFSISSNKWGWGPLDRDHFTYHRTPLTFWYKSDSSYAYSLFLINMIFFISLFFIFFQMIVILRFFYASKTISFNLITYITSLLKHFFLFYLLFNVLILASLLFQWFRLSFDFSIFNGFYSLAVQVINYVLDIVI